MITNCEDKEKPCDSCMRKAGYIVSGPSHWPVGPLFWEKTAEERATHALKTEDWWKFSSRIMYRACEYNVDECPPTDPYLWYAQPSLEKDEDAEDEDGSEDEAFILTADGFVKLSMDELSLYL